MFDKALVFAITVASCSLSIACDSTGGVAQIAATNDPVDSVVTSASPNFMRVGDTLTAFASAFDSAGHATMAAATRSWRLSDSAVVSLQPSTAFGGQLVHGIAPGVTAVTATISGVSGTDSVWVLPANASVHIQLSATQVSVGDTIIATGTLSNAGTVPVTIRRATLLPFSGTGAALVTPIDTLGHWRVVGFRSGSVQLKLTLGYVADTTTTSVVP